jgi:hypothetical protein
MGKTARMSSTYPGKYSPPHLKKKSEVLGVEGKGYGLVRTIRIVAEEGREQSHEIGNNRGPSKEDGARRDP